MRKCLHCLVATVAVSCLLSMGGAVADSPSREKPTRTSLSSTPWTPTDVGPQPKVIYGTDDRIDLYEETNGTRRLWAASTCALLRAGDVQENTDGTVTLRTFDYNVCPDEPFANQPAAAFCSGFMVGPDIIATAGHCFDNGDIGSVRFVFGFVMEDANTPVTTVNANQVYTGVELLGQALAGDLDYAVVRVDRTITAPNATPFDLRREGVIAVGAPIGVIGHPSGIPLKLAFGNDTVVRSNSNSGFFVANLDTYGGNSGSPVIDPNTGIVEGILVRGETDFVNDNGCLRSNVVSNTGGRGEDVSKSTTFTEFVPLLGSSLTLDQDAYGCGGTMEVRLTDLDLMGAASTTVDLVTSGGDLEVLTLNEIDSSGTFTGTIELVDAAVSVSSGRLEIGPEVTITATYTDVVHGPGAPDMLTASAPVDCIAPVIDGVVVDQVGTQAASVSFLTDEPSSGTVRFGTQCESPSGQATFPQRESHTVTLNGLLPDTTYFFFVEAMDAAGNLTLSDNGGSCFSFTTLDSAEYYTEYFPSAKPDLENTLLEFAPDETGMAFDVCRSNISALPIPTAGATIVGLADDGSVQISLADGAVFPFFGTEHTDLYINANGNITFTSNDSAFAPNPATHFELRRIAPCFSDLNPTVGGTMSYMQLADRLVITYSGLPHFDRGGSNTFQVELHFSGVIRMAYLELTAAPVVVGLSNGLGLQGDFASTNLSGQAACEGGNSFYHSADTSRNNTIELNELIRVIQFVNTGGYHCDAAGEDGYGAGPGEQSCTPHDSDYGPQDWNVNLTEILRLVQFFNVGGYGKDPENTTEDGFIPIATAKGPLEN